VEIIGLSGYARSGKDTAAAVLVEEFGFTRVAFADKLREVLYALDPIITADIEHHGMFGLHNSPDSVYGRLANVIDQFGWNGYKESPWSDEIRRLLQRLGTEAGRQTLWDSIWVDAALTGHDDDAKLVVTDVRFPNEAQAISEKDGQLWRVERTGVGPANSHASETSLDNWLFHRHLNNTGTLEEFRQLVRETYRAKQ
jgi:hypothetical protein